MGLRRILAAVVGTLQVAVGVLAVVFACILYFNFFNVQTELNTSVELLPLYSFALMIFGFFSIASGFFLFHERRESS